MNSASETETRFGKKGRAEILGIQLDRVGMEQTLEQVEEFIGSGTPHLIVTANVDTVVRSFTNQKFKEVVNSADLVVADGVPLVWASRFLGEPLPGRVNGTDLVYELCQLFHLKGYSLYFLGAGPGVAAEAAENLRQLFPRARIVGMHSPPMGPIQPRRAGGGGGADRGRQARYPAGSLWPTQARKLALETPGRDRGPRRHRDRGQLRHDLGEGPEGPRVDAKRGAGVALSPDP